MIHLIQANIEQPALDQLSRWARETPKDLRRNLTNSIIARIGEGLGIKGFS